MAGLILALCFLPQTDTPLPQWLVLFVCLGTSRIPALREGLGSTKDLAMALPYLVIALVALARFSSGDLRALGAEAAAATLLLASVSGMVSAGISRSRWRFAITTLPILAAMTFAWSLDRPVSVAAGELVLALLLGSATRGRRPT